MKAPAALPFYLYDFGAIQPDSFLQGDSFKLLEGVQTETVDMVFIDPPYFIKKAEWDTFENQQEYNDFMARAFWEAERILKPNGTLAFWHNDLQQVARLLCWLENWTQFVFNSWAVWVKPNFRKKLWANPGTGNTLRSWFNITEFCIVLVKGEPGTAWNKSGLALAKLDMNNFSPLREYFRDAQKHIGKTKKQIIDACGQAADHCFRWGSSQWLLPTRETYLDIVAKFELDSRPIEEGCQCPACRTYSRAYIRHLLKAKEMLGYRLCVLHNLYFYNKMMEEIREAIEKGCYQEYKQAKLAGFENHE